MTDYDYKEFIDQLTRYICWGEEIDEEEAEDIGVYEKLWGDKSTLMYDGYESDAVERFERIVKAARILMTGSSRKGG